MSASTSPAIPAAATMAPPLAQIATWIACLFLVLLSFPGLSVPGGVPPATALMLLAFPIWFVAALQRSGQIFDLAGTVASSMVIMCAFVISIWALASALDAELPFRAARPITSIIAAPIILFLVVGTLTRRTLDTYVALLLASLSVVCVISVLAIWTPGLNEFVFKQGADRAYGTFKNPNQFGIAISTMFPMALVLLVAGRRGLVLRIGVVIALMGGLIVTGSKTNLLMVTATTPICLIAFMTVRHTGAVRVGKVALSLVAYCGVGALFYFLLSVLNPRAVRLIGDFFSSTEEVSSLVSRQAIWQDSVDELLKDPLLGQGGGQLIHNGAHSHNLIIDYLRTLGVPGGTLVTVLVLVVIYMALSSILLAFRAKQAAVADRMLCIGLWVGAGNYLVTNMLSDSMGPSTSSFFFICVFFGIATRSLLIARRVS